MTFQQELASWNPFASSHKVSATPNIGDQAPSTPKLKLPPDNGRPTVITFLRHCGCPWAEKSFQLVRAAAEQNTDVNFVAVSHSDETATSHWLDAVGGAGKVEVVVDHEREIYGAFGLGLSSFWHNLNPWSMRDMINLGRAEGISVRPTESGSRWQTSGLFGVSSDGKVQYVHLAQQASDIGQLEDAMASVGK